MGNILCGVVAWVSRHAPKDSQREELKAAGFHTLRHIDPEGRLKSGRNTWAEIEWVCGGVPEVCIVIMPLGMLYRFFNDAPRGCKIVKATYDRHDPKHWTGNWREITDFNLETRRWQPQSQSG